jgi:hypothetical protein
MYLYQVSGDLVLEVWSGRGGHPLLKLRMKAEREADPNGPGVVVVYPEELDALMAALTEAAMVLCSGEHEEKER